MWKNCVYEKNSSLFRVGYLGVVNILFFIKKNVVSDENIRLEDQNLTAMSTALTAKEADRNKKLMDAIKALEECRSAMEEADNAVFKKGSKSAIADEKSKKAKDLFDEMLEADRELASLKIDIHLRIGIAAGDEDFEWLEKSAVIGDKQRDEADHLDTRQLDIYYEG